MTIQADCMTKNVLLITLPSVICGHIICEGKKPIYLCGPGPQCLLYIKPAHLLQCNVAYRDHQIYFQTRDSTLVEHKTNMNFR
uniref:Uncharacterized protein n=1 Tax=Pyxicephalus adspersus TaxID=30357 RepID=A0AAV3B111_PYXAD|nr:TPA: hypothetical protein GDO54_008655 [Pyxicephalus adspersus]